MASFEVVYYRDGRPHRRAFPTADDALGFVEGAADIGAIWSVGVYEDGEPMIMSGYVGRERPDAKQEAWMTQEYEKAQPDDAEP